MYSTSLKVTLKAYWFREFSISKVYWQGSDRDVKGLLLEDLVSPHFNLREL